MDTTCHEDSGILQVVIGDGRPLLLFTGLALVLSGGFALFLAASGQFLPHDVQFLGMAAEKLCSLHQCRIVHFMVHDRVAFGGSLVAVGSLYMWLAEFPLRNREPWAWWTFAITGATGFGSFLAYLGYGYLDTWHGVATLLLLPCFLLGLYRSYRWIGGHSDVRRAVSRADWGGWRSAFGLGRLLLLATAGGIIAGGFTILCVGMTTVFVPQDLGYMGLSPGQLHGINPRLIPLIAHDRAGFGGGITTCGILWFLSLWCARPSRNLADALLRMDCRLRHGHSHSSHRRLYGWSPPCPCYRGSPDVLSGDGALR